jgi:hypothetical protein
MPKDVFGGGDDRFSDGITFTAASPTGGIQRILIFQLLDDYARPWLSWLDKTGRHRAATGWHASDFESGGVHNRWEVKTDANPAGGQPNAMLTRIFLGSGADRSEAGVSNVTDFEINPGTYAQTSPTALAFRTPDSGGTTRLYGRIGVQLDASDNTILELDAASIANNKGATLKIGRQTNTSSSARKIEVKKMDGSNTDVLVIDCAKGSFEMTELGADPTAPPAGKRALYPKADGWYERDSAGVVTKLTN